MIETSQLTYIRYVDFNAQVMLESVSVTVTATVPVCSTPSAEVPATVQSNTVFGVATM